MSEELVKKLTGKNPKDFQFAASHLIEDADVEMFSKLVEKSDFLFDFIKRNVEKRLFDAVNDKNHQNLYKFLKLYSPDYDEFIIQSIVKYKDEATTDLMLNLLKEGSDDEKAYASKYFSNILDATAIEDLRNYAYSEFEPLAFNSTVALSKFNDDFSYQFALKKLESEDDFEILSAVRFLTAYGEENALEPIFKVMKKSSMAENIAADIPYLKPFSKILKSDLKNEGLWAINQILNGLGEIVSLAQIFDFELYEIIDGLIKSQSRKNDSKSALLLLHAKEKFDILTENDEYIFDEDKNTKEEVYTIKKLLNTQRPEFWAIQEDLFLSELNSESEFIYTALELTKSLEIADLETLKKLLSANQTIILKTVEVINSLGLLDEISQKEALENVSDENIKNVILSIF